jgi:hypothetical protein
LQSVGETTAAEKRAHHPNHERERVAERGHAQLIVDLGADDRELGECGIHQIPLELRRLPQHQPEDRGQRQQQREGGNEGEIRQ